MTIKIKIKFMGFFQSINGLEDTVMEFEKPIIVDMIIRKLESQVRQHGMSLIHLSNALILLNGRELKLLNGLKTKLSDGDEVLFLPVSHGG